jgi:hypothetical protein
MEYINNLDIIKSQFNTGDILLYHHKNDYSTLYNSFFSLLDDAIMWWTSSKFCHVSIIIKNPDFTSPPLTGLYILESNYENIKDIENQEYKMGVELIPLEELDLKDINLYWRKLEYDRNKEFYENLAKAHSIVHNRPYDIIPTDWIKAAFHLNIGNTQKKKTFWCSALVTFIYVQLNLLNKDISWTIISPKMLSSESTDLKFINCNLYNEIQII